MFLALRYAKKERSGRSFALLHIAFIFLPMCISSPLFSRFVAHIAHGLVIIGVAVLSAFTSCGRIVLLAFLVRVILAVYIWLCVVAHTIRFKGDWVNGEW